MEETMVNLADTYQQSPTCAASPLHLLIQNRSSSMQSITSTDHQPIVNMREVDADILELGVEKRKADLVDFDENGQRAVRAESFSSLSQEEGGATEEGEGDVRENMTDSSCEPLLRPSLSNKLIKNGSNRSSMPQIAEDSSSSHPLQEEKVCPADEDDYFIADVPTEDEVLKHQPGRHSRSDSFERRSQESAQFALAVGENSNLLLNKIIEEDSSSDFDDDDIDEEIKTEQQDGTEGRPPQPSPIHMTLTQSPTSDHVVQSLRLSSLAIHPPFVDWKFTRQYSSNTNMEEEKLGYKGIRTSLLEITQRGVSRGNYAQLHRKAWLEVSDRHHRYGKNLRLYYKHWENLGHPHGMFFDWLDSKGEATGLALPDLEECPRSVLDSDTVLYITDTEVSATYALDIVVDSEGSAIVLDRTSKRPVCTGKEGWIFVLRDHVLYGSQKVTGVGGCSPDGSCSTGARQRFHHSSFFGGKAVASAGIFLTNDQGRLTDLWPHSGHYRPGEAHMQRALFFMQQHGVDLSTFEVDMQQIFKVCRKKSPKDKAKKKDDAEVNNGEEAQSKKAKKTECLLNMGGFEVACFLAHKARMIEKNVFHQIHKIRRLPHESRGSVSAALELVNAS